MLAEAGSGTVELLVALKAVPPFASLPPEDVALLVARAKPRTFDAGDVVRRDLVARIVEAYDKAGNSK